LLLAFLFCFFAILFTRLKAAPAVEMEEKGPVIEQNHPLPADADARLPPSEPRLAAGELQV
jgi:hypothetical protein